MSAGEWYSATVSETGRLMKTDLQNGLSPVEARARLKRFGLNQLPDSGGVSALKIFLRQFKDALTLILIASAGLSLLAGFLSHEGGESIKESALIGVIILLNIFIGFINEYKAENTVKKLKGLVSQQAFVVRGGKTIGIDSRQVVPGDILILETGQKIAADARVISVSDLSVNEALLSGESLPVDKQTLPLRGKVELADRTNMVLAGSFVAGGRGSALVIATGGKTALGDIARLVSETTEAATPLEGRLSQLGRRIGVVASGLCALVFLAVLVFSPEHASDSWLARLSFAFTAAVALAVAVVPEGLAVVVRISLALGARRMARSKALVRHLSAVEALGSTDVICTDKTGTLTTGEMSLVEVMIDGLHLPLQDGRLGKDNDETHKKLAGRLLLTAALCNNAGGSAAADTTEVALIKAARDFGIDTEHLDRSHPRLEELPFSSETKRMSTLHRSSDAYISAHKGALESIIKLCSHYIDEKGVRRKLTKASIEKIEKQHDDMASRALRVLAFGAATHKQRPERDELEKNLTFVGLGGLFDAPRQEVAEVIGRIQRESGVWVMMITGDHAATAAAVADQIGLKGKVMTGAELDKLPRHKLEQLVEEIAVLARVSPEHKIRVVEALKKQGHQVAMTGDGVNDAPAIKAANVGIAMGITGSDVAKEAADLILLDDRFVTIVAAIEEGRTIYDNVQKFVNFLISCNVAEFAVVFFGLLFFHDLVLSAAQILFINIVTDGLPAIALGSDPAKPKALKDSPRNYQRPIITRQMWLEMAIFAVVMSVAVLLPHKLFYGPQEHLVSLAAIMAGVVVHEMTRLVDIRTDYRIRWFANPWLSVSMLASLLATVFVIYAPVMANYFGLTDLRAIDWSLIIGATAIIFIIMKLVTPVTKRLLPD